MKNNFYKLHRKLTKLRSRAALDLQKKHHHTLKHLKNTVVLLPEIELKTKKLLAGATLAGSLLFLPLQISGTKLLDRPAEERLKIGLVTSDEFKNYFSQKLLPLLPSSIGKLSKDEEEKICALIKDVLGVDVCGNLEGNELNFHYAWTGYEQHLYRYPGDDLDQHDEELIAGIAPGLGAWGYFSDSKESLDEKVKLREKYYVAVQTLYLPEWQTRSEELYQWYKYRKMIMINPENGTACVAVVGDAGPADWTGKQFGGSPEVMKTLDLHEEWRKGKVLLLFVDDPKDEIPLGPLDYNYAKGQVKEA